MSLMKNNGTDLRHFSPPRLTHFCLALEHVAHACPYGTDASHADPEDDIDSIGGVE